MLIFAAEDGVEDVILPGLLAEGTELLRVAIVEGVRHGKTKSDFMLSPEHVDLLRQRLRQDPDIKLILVDPIASFIGRTKVDDHRAAELRLVLDPLSELAESAGVTIVMIAHLNKSTGDAVDRFAGSAAYRDTVRAAYLITEDSEDESRRLLLPAKENLASFDRTTIPFSLVPLPAYEVDALLKRDEFRGLSADDLATVRGQLRRVHFDTARAVDPNEAMKGKKTDGTKVQRCKEWLKTLLAKYAYSSKEITDAGKEAGFSFDNMKEAKAQLKSEGVISHSPERFPGGWWSGTGAPSTWVARPEPLPTTPLCSPLPTPPQLEREESSGELGTSGEWGAEGDSTHQAPHLPAPVLRRRYDRSDHYTRSRRPRVTHRPRGRWRARFSGRTECAVLGTGTARARVAESHHRAEDVVARVSVDLVGEASSGVDGWLTRRSRDWVSMNATRSSKKPPRFVDAQLRRDMVTVRAACHAIEDHARRLAAQRSVQYERIEPVPRWCRFRRQRHSAQRVGTGRNG